MIKKTSKKDDKIDLNQAKLEIDKQFDIFMSELQIIKRRKNEIMKKIDSIISKNKLDNIRKKYLNN
jgi:predicted  nucleic acid-binding Zn-ribbon protein